MKFNTHLALITAILAPCLEINAQQPRPEPVAPAVASQAAKGEHDSPQANKPSQPTPSPVIVGRFVAIDNVCAWPNLAMLRDGTIIATIFNQPTHGGWEGDVECWASRDGRLWEKIGTPAPHEPGTNRMNVGTGLARDGSLIVLASGWSNRTNPGTKRGFRIPEEADILPVWICRSSDGGRSWTRGEATVPPPPGGPARLIPFGDIVTLADGSLGACIYGLEPKTREQSAHFYTSKDDGHTWSVRGLVRKGNINETTLVVLPGGRLLAAGRTLDDQHLDLFTSDDHGATWKCTGAVTAGSQHPADLMVLADGRLLLSYGNRGSKNFGVEAKLSSDGGVTWSDPISLVSDLSSGDCGYPSSVQLPGGEIVTAYYAAGVASHQRYHMGTVIWKLPSDPAAKPDKKAAVPDIGSRRELFVDDFLIERFGGKAELRLHHPSPREVAITFDQPWEGNGSGFITIMPDGDLYRMIYRGSRYVLDPKGLRRGSGMNVCYAESRDGIHWTKPNLGLFDWTPTKNNSGRKENNIVWRGGPEAENFAPFKDTTPACPAEQRYKAVGGTRNSKGLLTFKSADGVRWSRLSEGPVVTKGAFDSLNTVFWDPERQRYSMYVRFVSEGEFKGLRSIGMSYSTDFNSWSEPVELTYPKSPPQQMYTNNVAPYYRAPHILMGFPTRYVARPMSEHLRSLDPVPLRAALTAADARTGSDLTDGVFMTSRDGESFRRWDEAFLRPGSQTEGRWIYGDNFQSYGLFETKASAPGAPNEISMLFSEDYWIEGKSRARRYTIRLDGFVSVNAPYSGGEVVTKSLKFSGKELVLNYATSAAGSIRVEVQNAHGTALPDFGLADSVELIGDSVEQVVRWKSGADVSSLVGQSVRLRFVMKDADVYAFQFVE